MCFLKWVPPLSLIITVACAGWVAADHQTQSTGWLLVDTVTHENGRDTDRFRFDVLSGRHYEVKIDHDSYGEFEVLVEDSKNRVYTSRQGSRTVTAPFDTLNGYQGRMYLDVNSLGATGRYRVYLRDSGDTGYNDSYPYTDSSSAWELVDTASHSNSRDTDKFQFDVQAGRSYEVKIDHESSDPYEVVVKDRKGKVYADERGSRTVLGSFDTLNNYSGRMYLEVASRGAKGDYRVYLREGSGSSSSSHNCNPSYGHVDNDQNGNDLYTLIFPDNRRGGYGEVTVTFRGTAVQMSGRVFGQRSASRDWTGTGTVRGDVMDFDWRLTNGGQGTARVVRQRNGDWEGTYQPSGPGSAGKPQALILRPGRDRTNR